MEIEIVELEERKCKFILKNSTPAKANALRRTMLSNIPKMAIDEVEFHLGPIDVDGKEYESVTPLFDEIIAHRLGMIPIPTNYELFNTKAECSCGGVGCPSCEIMYSLNKHGPCTVMSGDLQPLGDASLKVKDENIPIVELADGQSVLIYAHAIMGTAKQHVKWQVANGVGYKYMPIIKIDQKKVVNANDIASLCPKRVFDVKDKKLVAERSIDCILCMTCVERGDSEAISIKGDDTCFVFKFETDGSLTAQQVLDKAKSILSEGAKNIADAVVAL
ncbi:MAG: DNA-directed RNA polymerase subunit D [archaeon]|nr:DNA-directed RNA polymerase subunit D [archaeon]